MQYTVSEDNKYNQEIINVRDELRFTVPRDFWPQSTTTATTTTKRAS